MVGGPSTRVPPAFGPVARQYICAISLHTRITRRVIGLPAMIWNVFARPGVSTRMSRRFRRHCTVIGDPDFVTHAATDDDHCILEQLSELSSD